MTFGSSGRYSAAASTAVDIPCTDAQERDPPGLLPTVDSGKNHGMNALNAGGAL